MSEDTNKPSPLQLAREAKAKREAEAQAAKEALELAVLELEEKLAATVGRQGIDFDIVVTADGPVGVKRGNALVFERFQKAGNIDPKTLDEYVVPCLVEMKPETYRAIVEKFPVVAVRCATALSQMFGAKANDDLGKF